MAINLYGYNTQRITGLASGMDTQSMVNNMMAVEQLKVDKVFQKREKAQWQLDAYTELNKSVNNLRNSYLSVLGDKSLVKNSAFNVYKVNMRENTAIKITGTASALPANFQITGTTKATAASMTMQVNTRQNEAKGAAGMFLQESASGKLVSPEDGSVALSQDTTIKDLAAQFGLGEDESLSFSINGETFTFAQDTKLSEVVTKVNESEKANATMAINYTSGVTFLKSDAMGEDSKLTLSNITGKAFASDAGFGIATNSPKKALPQGFENLTFRQLANLTGAEDPGDSFTLKVEGKGDFTVSGLGSKTIAQVMDEVNSAANTTGVEMKLDKVSGTFAFRSDTDKPFTLEGGIFGEKGATGIAAGVHKEIGNVKRGDTLHEVARKLGVEIGDQNGKVQLTVNGKDFEFDVKTDTLYTVMDTVNKDKDAKAVFGYSEMTDSFQFSAAETGKDAKLNVSGSLYEMFQTKDSNGNVTNLSTTAGKDAMLSINMNGVSKDIVQSGNEFTMDGIRFEITEDFKADPATGVSNISVSVDRDYQPTIDAIKGFIEDYNKLVGDLNTKYNEKTYRTYQPLTEDQRAGLTEEEAKKWDEKAKSGILRNNSAIGGLLTSLRSVLIPKVGDTGLSAFDLGITTKAWADDSWRSDQGKLVLDEEKLRAALAENPNAVQEAFTKITTTSDGKTDVGTTQGNEGAKAQSGILVRMNAFFNDFYKAVRDENVKTTQQSINDYTEKMSDMVMKMAAKEERYWAQYSKMETMLSQMQSQQNWLATQMGMSAGGK